VASRSEVDELVSDRLKDLPPVRGVVHGTMVLRVSRSPCLCAPYSSAP
jgi:hypothetical protein